MPSRVINHLRSNAIAYLALGCSLLALAGGAYAASSLPANSVGARQIRNGSVTPAKLNHSAIGGTILHWAQVDASGRILSGSRGAREMFTPHSAGTSEITWGDAIPNRCTVMATVQRGFPPSPLAGLISAVKVSAGERTGVIVDTYDTTGARVQLPFSVAVIC
jgi:hypothetical protein